VNPGATDVFPQSIAVGDRNLGGWREIRPGRMPGYGFLGSGLPAIPPDRDVVMNTGNATIVVVSGGNIAASQHAGKQSGMVLENYNSAGNLAARARQQRVG